MKFTYPTDLPISQARDEIVEAITHSQVVIISGETGSGKTTQLPKMLLEMGRGTHGHQIVHTQPRRLAAYSVAERISHELQTSLGQEVGVQVRFNDKTSPHTRLRVVTDGILLAQIQRDPLLSKYDTIVIDEAHERSLNIDFLLGYLTSLLPKRRDLKLIITSATIDATKFQEHFEQALKTKVPVLSVSGRTFPVQIFYEPLGSNPALMKHVAGFNHVENTEDSEHADNYDMATAVARACKELIIHSQHTTGARDILVFASGERDIHEFEHAIRKYLGVQAQDMKRADAIEIIPLFARLSSKDQHKIFESHEHQRIIIATNVAETSLTVPGIRYVVDSGTARISRYSKTAKVQRLPIEPISQASANQRSGRCGRIADGIAIRLYSREDFESRPEFGDPEILRTSLGSVILHMLSTGVAHTISDITDFGFIDQPDVKAINDGLNELQEIQAITRKRDNIQLTAVGKKLSRIPIDIRLARMIIQAAQDSPNTLATIIIIAAFLSIQDPRERPEDQQEEADHTHRRFMDSTSDFLTILNIWDFLFQADGSPSNSMLRKKCKHEFLHYIRVRQWRDLVEDLQTMCRSQHWTIGSAQPRKRPDLAIRQLPTAQQAHSSLCCSWNTEAIHTAMLSGLLSMIGMQIIQEPKASDYASLHGAARAKAMKRAQKMAKNTYQGARNTRFSIFPSSGLSKTTPEWIMCTELVETSRLWARYCAQIDPAWVQPLAGSLTRTTYADPHWSSSRGSAVASSTILLYGLPIVRNKIVQWGRINPVEARDFLIRQGLIENDIRQRFSYDNFIARNIEILEESQEEAHRTRNIIQSINDEDLYDFYNSVIPNTVTSVAHLARWWKQHHTENPHLLDFDPESVERLTDSQEYSEYDYPNYWYTTCSDNSKVELRLSYIYDQHDPADGVSVHIPIHILSRISSEEFTWNVPGLLHELIISYIKALPKTLRIQFVPGPDTARTIEAYIQEHYDLLPGMKQQETEDSISYPDFAHVFTQAAIDTIGAQIHPEVLQQLTERIPNYLRVTFVVEEQITKRNSKGKRFTKTQVLGTSKSLQELQHRFAQKAQQSARKVIGDKIQKAGNEGKVVQQANLLHNAGATQQHRSEILWDAALELVQLPQERITSRWLGEEKLLLSSAPYTSTKLLVQDLQLAAVKRLLPNINEQVNNDEDLQTAVAGIQQIFEDTVYEVVHDVINCLKKYATVDSLVSGVAELPLLSVLQSIKAHLQTLVYDGFIGKTPAQYLPRIATYIQADSLRLQKAKADKNRDVRWSWQADEAQEVYKNACKQVQQLAASPHKHELEEQCETIRWMVEEYYISLWAQELGTLKPISVQRIRKLAQSVQ
ncbi:MAG: ATP-dependent RNA helicase HrpA [Bifidobacteriaceae bacterium]|nr:ATP-dependent RNA helicase HrpA [Bifidobacteriaceae bacterium]